MDSSQNSPPENQKQAITSFVRKEESSEVQKCIKDEDLLSGRLNNNLGPVIFNKSPSINQLVQIRKSNKQNSKSGHSATMHISIQSNPSRPSNVSIDKGTGGQHCKSQVMLFNSNGQNNTGKGQIIDQEAQMCRTAGETRLINQDLNDLDGPTITGLENFEKKNIQSSGVTSKAQLVKRKKVEVPKKTHQQMMEEIESIGAISRERLLSKQMHMQSGPNGNYQYRSKSAFMKRPQQTAGAYGRKEELQHLPNNGILDHQNLVLKNEAFSSECKTAKEQRTDRDARNQKQINQRNRQHRRIGTAIDPQYGGFRQRNAKRYDSAAESSQLVGSIMRGVRGTDTNVMRQSQQNLNKLRMSRASISNLNAINMKKSYEQFTSNYKIQQNLGVSGSKLQSISLNQFRSQTAMSQLSRYRNSIKNYQAFYQQKTTQENPTTAEYIDQSREGTLSNTTGIQGPTFLQSPFEGQDYDPQSGKTQIKSAQNRTKRPVPPLDLNRNTRNDDYLSNPLITSQLMIQGQAQKRGKSGHIVQKNRRYGEYDSRNNRNVYSQGVKHQKLSVMGPQMIRQTPQPPEPGSVGSLSPDKQQLDQDASLNIQSEKTEKQAIQKDKTNSALSGFENIASPQQTSSGVKREQIEMNIQDYEQKPKDFTVQIQNKKEPITNEYDLLDSNIKNIDQNKSFKSTLNKQSRFVKQQQPADQLALQKSLKIEKLANIIGTQNTNQNAQMRKQKYESRFQNPNLSFAKKQPNYQSPCFKVSSPETAGLDLEKEIQDSFDRYDVNESKEKANSDILGSHQTTDKCGKGSSHRYVEQQQYLPLQKLNLVNINVQRSNKKLPHEAQANTTSPHDDLPQPQITPNRFLSSRQKRGTSNYLKKPEPLSGQTSFKLCQENSKSQVLGPSKQKQDQKQHQILKTVKSSTYLAALTNEFQKELKRITDIKNQQFNKAISAKSDIVRSSSANTNAAQVTFLRAPSEMRNQAHRRSRQNKSAISTDQNRKFEQQTAPLPGSNTNKGLNFDLTIYPQASATRPVERKSSIIDTKRKDSQQAKKTVYYQGKQGSKGREITADDEEILESDHNLITDGQIMQPASTLNQIKKFAEFEQTFDQDQQSKIQQSQQYQFSKSSRIIIQNDSDQAQSRNQPRMRSQEEYQTLRQKGLQSREKLKTPSRAGFPPPDPPKSLVDKTSDTRTEDVIPESLHSIEEKMAFRAGTHHKAQGDDRFNIHGILSQPHEISGKSNKAKLYDTALDNCPLKSVREKEELELILMQQHWEDEKKLRAINRAEFEERQNDLAFRKASQQMEKRNAQQIVNTNLMSSPIQSMGNLSLISLREDAIMTQSTAYARRQYLNKPISLKNQESKSISPISSKQQKPQEDYFQMNISNKLCNKINRQYQQREKQKKEEQERLQKIREKLAKGFSALFAKNKPNKQNVPNKQNEKDQKQVKENPKKFSLINDKRLSNKDEENDNEFKMDLIQTNQDQIVYLRLNPHLPDTSERAKVNIADQSLNALLNKNGGLPIHEMETGTKKGKAMTKYKDLNDFQKETYNLIKKLKRDVSHETLYARLWQYIKENRDEEKLNEFCKELTQTKNVIRQQQAAKQKLFNKQQASARKQQNGPQSQQNKSLNKKGQPKFPLTAKQCDELRSPQSSVSNMSGNLMKQTAGQDNKGDMLKNTPSKKLQTQLVEGFLQEKEKEKERKAQLAQEEKEFQKITRQKKGSRFYLTKQERQNILEKLDDVYVLEAEQKKFFAQHIRQCKKERYLKGLKNDMDYYFQQKEKQSFQKIKEQINKRHNHKKYSSEDSTMIQDYSSSVRNSEQRSKSASGLQDTQYTIMQASNITQSSISEIIQLSEDDSESESFGPPPQDAILLQQKGIDFLDLDEEIILQNLFKQFNNHNQEQIPIEKGEIKIEIENIDQTFDDRKKNEGKVHQSSQQIQDEQNDQQDKIQFRSSAPDESQIIQQKQLLDNDDYAINVDNELQDLDFFKSYISSYENKQKILDQKLGKYQTSTDEIQERGENEQNFDSQIDEIGFDSVQTNYNPFSSTQQIQTQGSQIQNRQQFAQGTSFQFGASNMTSNMDLLSPDQFKRGKSINNTVGTILQKKQKRDPNCKKLEQTFEANVNLLKNIHHKRNMQQGRKWGLQTATVTVLDSRYTSQIQKNTERVQNKTVLAEQNPSRKKRASIEIRSKDKQSVFDIARLCHDELPSEMVRFGRQPGSKSTVNLSKMERKLTKAQDQQEEVIDKIEKVYNNIDRVRVNEPADHYEDILISNIQDEDNEAVKFEKQHIKAVKSVYEDEKWAKCVLSAQTKMRYDDPNSVKNIRLYFKSHLQDFTEAETS